MTPPQTSRRPPRQATRAFWTQPAGFDLTSNAALRSSPERLQDAINILRVHGDVRELDRAADKIADAVADPVFRYAASISQLLDRVGADIPRPVAVGPRRAREEADRRIRALRRGEQDALEGRDAYAAPFTDPMMLRSMDTFSTACQRDIPAAVEALCGSEVRERLHAAYLRRRWRPDLSWSAVLRLQDFDRALTRAVHSGSDPVAQRRQVERVLFEAARKNSQAQTPSA